MYSLALIGAGCADFFAALETEEATPIRVPVASGAQPTPQADPAQAILESAIDGAINLPMLFVSNRGNAGNKDIYQINGDGSGLIRLTSDPAADLISYGNARGSDRSLTIFVRVGQLVEEARSG